MRITVGFHDRSVERCVLGPEMVRIPGSGTGGGYLFSLFKITNQKPPPSAQKEPDFVIRRDWRRVKSTEKKTERGHGVLLEHLHNSPAMDGTTAEMKKKKNLKDFSA